VRLHGAPACAIRRLDRIVRGVRLLKEGAVIPQAVSTVGMAGFNDAILNRVQACAFQR